MDRVTSCLDVGESLYPVDEFRVEDDIGTFGARFAHLPHVDSKYTLNVYKVYGRSRVDATGGAGHRGVTGNDCTVRHKTSGQTSVPRYDRELHLNGMERV